MTTSVLHTESSIAQLQTPIDGAPSNMDNGHIMIEPPSDANHLWWWKRCAPLLEILLNSSNIYTLEQKIDHMRIFRDVVVPSFGLPTPSAKATPLLASDGSPFEPSWNFTKNKNIVRYTFEPITKEAGTDKDIFGSNNVPSMVSDLTRASSDVDMRWFNQVMEAWFVFDEEAAKSKAAMPPHMPRIPQIFLAFDMKASKRHLKAYFFPIHKHFATGIPTEQLTFDLVRKLKPCGEQFEPAVQKLEKYLAKCTILRPVEMIAIDCIDPTKSSPRVKVYARSNSVAKSVLRDCVTLRGAQTGEKTIKAMENLEKIWHLLLDESSGMTEDQNKDPITKHPLHVGICFVFEMRPGSEHIDVKCHVPYGNYQKSDGNAVASFGAALKALGFDGEAEVYGTGMAGMAKLPGQNFSKAGAVSYFAYNYGEDGSYLSSYFSPLCMEQ